MRQLRRGLPAPQDEWQQRQCECLRHRSCQKPARYFPRQDFRPKLHSLIWQLIFFGADTTCSTKTGEMRAKGLQAALTSNDI